MPSRYEEALATLGRIAQQDVQSECRQINTQRRGAEDAERAEERSVRYLDRRDTGAIPIAAETLSLFFSASSALSAPLRWVLICTLTAER